MSDLQASLLAIGFGVVVAIYVFGWWQQRQYRRKFGAAFKVSHADALYQEGIIGQSGQTRQAEFASAVDEVAGIPVSTMPDESCALLDTRTDFIIELHLDEPGPAAVLDGLWQRKFDFGKQVQVCGLTLTSKHWERAIAEGQTLYARFRVALQLVDRSGVISAAKLADFRDLVLGVAKHIKADTTVPDINKTHHQAVELDAFCAEVDQMVGVNLVPQGERALIGANIAQAADAQGMTLESDGAFHLFDAQGHSLFSLSNQDTQPFQPHALDTFSTSGITLLLDVPRVENPALHFDRMMRVAHELAGELQVNVVDDHGAALNDSSLARIRAQIAEVEAKMRDRAIEPGSAQARRLFS